MEEYSNSIPSLPTDILIEVFCRLPVKTLVRLCCVCKFWKYLISSNPIFTRCHLKQQSLKKTSRSSSNVIMYSIRTDTKPTQEISVQRFINADENSLRNESFFLGPNFYMVGFINGVFCFYEYWSKDVYLWNPALHQFRTLPRCCDCRLCHVVAFFSEPTTDDYMVVKIHKYTSKVHIYKLSSDSWKETNFPYRLSDKYICIKDMVALVHNGALHWLSYNIYGSSETLFLNVYDLSRKRFQETLLSNYIPFETFFATPGLIKGCISIVGMSTTDPLKYEVWMMKEYGVEKSWTKQFEFEVPRYINVPRYLPGTRTSGKLVVTQGNYDIIYDLETEETEFAQHESILCGVFPQYFFTDNYVESLVSVFPPVKITVDETTPASCSSFPSNTIPQNLSGTRTSGKLVAKQENSALLFYQETESTQDDRNTKCIFTDNYVESSVPDETTSVNCLSFLKSLFGCLFV